MTLSNSVTPAEANELLARGEAVEIIDVREPDEYRQARVTPSRLIPLRDLPRELEQLDRSKTYLMLCRSGNRSGVATRQLRASGFEARNIEGGILAWMAENLPVVKGA